MERVWLICAVLLACLSSYHAQLDPYDRLRFIAASELSNIPQPEYIGVKTYNRPARVIYPEAYGSIHYTDKMWPLVMVLHGYGSYGNYHDFYLGISERSSSYGYVTLIPNGTVNSQGKHFWNGLNCCDWDHTGVDDVGYLNGIVQEAIQTLQIDASRVYIVGHSNGASMTQILACNSGQYYAGIASISPGETPEVCNPPHPMSVLVIQGTEDEVIPFHFSEQVRDKWRTLNQCKEKPSKLKVVDFDCIPNVPAAWDSIFDPYRDHNCAIAGKETTMSDWYNCTNGLSTVSHWALKGAHHNPAFNFEFSDVLMSHLLKFRQNQQTK